MSPFIFSDILYIVLVVLLQFPRNGPRLQLYSNFHTQGGHIAHINGLICDLEELYVAAALHSAVCHFSRKQSTFKKSQESQESQ
jgi:hypothetical protein